MLYAVIIGGALMALLSIIFRVAAIFRLTLPLAYALIVPTFFQEWASANHALSEYIFYALVGLTVLSWIVSLIRKICEYRDDRLAAGLIFARIAQARAEGRDPTRIRVDDLYR